MVWKILILSLSISWLPSSRTSTELLSREQMEPNGGSERTSGEYGRAKAVEKKERMKLSFSVGAGIPEGESYWRSGVSFGVRVGEALNPSLFLTQEVSLSRFVFDRSAFYDEGYRRADDPSRFRRIFSEWEVKGRNPNMDLVSLNLGLAVFVEDIQVFQHKATLSFLGSVGLYRSIRDGMEVTYRGRREELLKPRKEDGFGACIGLRVYSEDFFVEVSHHSAAFPGGDFHVGRLAMGMEFGI